ncbi:hypothetical protein Tco_1176117 [Tanacetum coccineum]
MSPGYGALDFVSSWFLVKCRHRYAVSSLMDTAYRMSEQMQVIDFGVIGNFDDLIEEIGTPPLLPIPLPVSSTSHRADIPKADTPPRKRLLLTTPRHGCEKDRVAMRAEIEVLRRERLAYEQESMETRQALARSEAYCMVLEARVTVLETKVHHHEWQCQAADDLVVQHIMRTQAMEARARIDTLEDTSSSS